MDEKKILALYASMLTKLEAIEAHIAKNDWEAVTTISNEVVAIERKIKTNDVSVEQLMASSSSFAKEQPLIKSKLLSQIEKNKTHIEEWKKQHAGKIAGSKNVLDNMSRYYKPQNSSYYVDKNE